MSIETLARSVQFNCDLSDREFAADYSICIYLIRMREYYRWAHGIAPDATLHQAALMDWVSAKENTWEALEQVDFQPLVYQGETFSAFDVEALNLKLQPSGYTYSAGYGRFSKPIFVLAELESVENTARYCLTLAGRELARELVAPPAVMQSGEIFIRTESVTRMVWDLFEEWQWHKPDNAMAEFVRFYDFENKPMKALKAASVDQREVLILHEIGEFLAGDLLADSWNEMLGVDDKHLQLFARGARDYLADCLSTLPGLLATGNVPGLHFYFASLTPMRKAMFPSLVDGYQQWRYERPEFGLQRAITHGQKHWLSVARQLTDTFDSQSPSLEPGPVTLQSYIEGNAL